MAAGTTGARKQNAARGPRGAISKRRTALRTDKDGDLSMGGPPSRERGGISKSKPPSGPANDVSGRKPRSAATAGRLKNEVMRHMSSGSASARGGRRAPFSGRLEEVVITGWSNSKASGSDDRGVSALIAFLEKRATLRNATKKPVRIQKKRIDQDDLIISVAKEDTGSLLKLDGFVFSGVNIKVQRVRGDSDDDGTTQNTIAMLRGVLERRYNTGLKLLDLSALGQDPDLKASAIFDSSTTTSKFFPALMRILDKQFETTAQKDEAVQSVSLANNDLVDLTAVTTLAQTLPQLKNLDLSANKFAKVADIELWRKRFSKLDHLVISGNPIEQSEPELAKTLISWYPRLRLLNSVQVRTDAEAATAHQVTDLPFPIRSPVFQDEGQIAENFVRTFFAGYDSDRAALANMYYDATSDFSFSVNTAAPRDPNNTEQGAQDWADYIRGSRNLRKLNHLPAQQARLATGPSSIAEQWARLPVTRHPDLAADAKKWLIECQLQPGLPDPTGQSPGGVDGFLITIHGEFDEMDVSTGQSNKRRSFDRTFIIGPGGPNGVRVVNDMLTIRAYGGVQAFEAEDNNTNNIQQIDQPAVVPGVPAHLTTEMAERMVLELQKQTAMTLAYAKDCLEQVTWDFDRALQAFATVKANLPPDAFLQAQVPTV